MLDEISATGLLLVALAIAPAVYFVLIGLGRFLKRRLGVRLGVLFQLFSVTLAVYVSLAVCYPQSGGVLHEIRRAMLALAILLGTFFVGALFRRFLWEGYFEKRREIEVPKFVHEVVGLILFLVALIIVMDQVYDLSIKGIVAGSGVAAIIIGLAMQDLLGNIIGGVALEVGRPFTVGDWLHVEGEYGQVTEMNWRSVRLRTNDDICLDIPNNEIVKHKITNLNYPTKRHAMRLDVKIDYNVPPNTVKDILVHAAASAAHVLEKPRPKAFLRDFGEYAIQYQVKFYMDNHQHYNATMDAVRTNIWYELRRVGIRIPLPIRTLRIQRSGKVARESGAAVRALRRQEVFECLSDDQLERLAANGIRLRYGRREKLIEQGAEGDSMFILIEGDAEVQVASPDGRCASVATLSGGECFGEMSLLTGERRSATVVARTDCEVLEIKKADMGALIQDQPELMSGLSDLLAERRMETEGILAETEEPDVMEAKRQEYSESILAKFTSYFGL